MARSVLSPYGSRVTTGAGALDIVIKGIPLGREFTEEEVAQEVRQRQLPSRDAVYEHLYSLEQRGHIRRTPGGWERLN